MTLSVPTVLTKRRDRTSSLSRFLEGHQRQRLARYLNEGYSPVNQSELSDGGCGDPDCWCGVATPRSAGRRAVERNDPQVFDVCEYILWNRSVTTWSAKEHRARKLWRREIKERWGW